MEYLWATSPPVSSSPVNNLGVSHDHLLVYLFICYRMPEEMQGQRSEIKGTRGRTKRADKAAVKAWEHISVLRQASSSISCSSGSKSSFRSIPCFSHTNNLDKCPAYVDTGSHLHFSEVSSQLWVLITSNFYINFLPTWLLFLQPIMN